MKMEGNMMKFRSLVISVITLMLLLIQIDASSEQSSRETRVDGCSLTNVNACDFISCENNGLCIEDSTTVDCFRCQCQVGYTGKICDTPIAILPIGCNPGCQNGGVCNINVCVCPSGFTGTFCETKDYCLPSNPCQNNGRCFSTANSYICDCSGTGYTGILCTERLPTDPCNSNPCQNNGQCFSNGQTMNCICTGGYSGIYCQIPPITCAGNFCQNGGKCQLTAGNIYRCVCPEQFTGTQCETSISVQHPCITMPTTVCQNGGECLINGPDYLCKCVAGWSGRNCQIQKTPNSCLSNPCGTHGGCVEATSPSGSIAYCNCDDGWTGKYCDVNMNVVCSADYCLSGGQCVTNGNALFCICPASYTGPRCEILVTALTTTTTSTSTLIPTIGSCLPNPCLNNGVCLYNGNTNQCACKIPWSGLLCDIFTMPTITPTMTTTPVTTSTITNVLTTTTIITVALTCENAPCKNGGTCVPIGTSYSCFCGLNSIYTGKNCDSTTPMPINECPLNCAPGRCIFSGYAQRPYACLWNGVMRPIEGTTG